jgi:hypothetical protein
VLGGASAHAHEIVPNSVSAKPKQSRCLMVVPVAKALTRAERARVAIVNHI